MRHPPHARANPSPIAPFPLSAVWPAQSVRDGCRSPARKLLVHGAGDRLHGPGRLARGAAGQSLYLCNLWHPTIEMMKGRTVEQKKKLVEEITRVSVEILGGSPESVDILITDIKRENWATGGKLWLERTA